jgi:putative tryptophan/tyrosine transport system substrate-binding protein
MRRRHFIKLLATGAVAWPCATHAQQGAKTPRIGMLSPNRSEGPDPSRATLDALVTRLRELGYIEGQNIAFERRFGESNPDRLRDRAAELAGLKVDIIAALSTTAARAARQATSAIPIVGIGMADPVEDELVASLARPGGNVTGTSFLGPELVAKRLQLLREVVPQLSRVAVLWHPRAYSDRTMTGMLKEIEGAARSLGVQLQLIAAAGPDDIAAAFATMGRERVEALILFPSPLLSRPWQRTIACR